MLLFNVALLSLALFTAAPALAAHHCPRADAGLPHTNLAARDTTDGPAVIPRSENAYPPDTASLMDTIAQFRRAPLSPRSPFLYGHRIEDKIENRRLRNQVDQLQAQLAAA
ncbi:hypothetical protein F5148DRAFT_1149616 [Russula earlei]|uniref:Uncharacterized protein n=1 Tax=Russula earlei TaxID=71964 RepID=A0ACC0U8Y9_9AGAM|nr:hypothetical protein F5148DRAFT_1149616 [Russula earlei]